MRGIKYRTRDACPYGLYVYDRLYGVSKSMRHIGDLVDMLLFVGAV